MNRAFSAQVHHFRIARHPPAIVSRCELIVSVVSGRVPSDAGRVTHAPATARLGKVNTQDICPAATTRSKHIGQGSNWCRYRNCGADGSKGLLCPEHTFSTVSWIAVSGGCFVSPHLLLSHNFCCSEAGLQHARYPAKPRECHMVPMRFTNTPLWLYFRSVRSSEKSVKL